MRRVKAWKPDDAVKLEAVEHGGEAEVGGGRAAGKKHEASEERAENLGRRESEETGWAKWKHGVRHEEAKAGGMR